MKLVSSIADLESMDNFLNDLTKKFITPLGSVFRVACQALKNWGIEVTEENKDWIKERSTQSYKEEWENNAKEVHDAISNAIVAVGLGEGNKQLNRKLAETVRDILKSWASEDSEREFVICDVGAGTGNTTIAIHQRLAEDSETASLVKRVRYYLIEPSFEATNEANKKLKAFKLGRQQVITAFDDEHYPFVREKRFDVVVSNAVFHHKSFPDYLLEIHRLLVDDGVLVFGDWYSRTWYQPHTVVSLIKDLDEKDGGKIAMDFMDFFDLSFKEVEDFTKSFDEGERKAHESVITYKKVLAKELKELNERLGKTEKDALKQYILEAYEPLSDRLEKLSAHGFEVDLIKLKETHKGFKSLDKNIKQQYPGTNLACVVAVAKK